MGMQERPVLGRAPDFNALAIGLAVLVLTAARWEVDNLHLIGYATSAVWTIDSQVSCLLSA